MEGQKLSVVLSGPAKIDGVREPAGKTVLVTTTQAIQLAASGVINPVDINELGSDIASDMLVESDFNTAVEKAAAEKAGVLIELAVLGATAPLKDEIAKLQNGNSEASKLLDEAQKAILALTKELEAERQERLTAETNLAQAQAELQKLQIEDSSTQNGNKSGSGKPTK